MEATPDQSLDAATANEAAGLASIVAELHQGPWRFIQLRGAPLGAGDILDLAQDSSGDVDLLGTSGSVHQLLEAAAAWTHAGRCHLWIQARSKNKMALALVSPDGRHAVKLDLWTELWQLDGGSSCLRYEDCQPLIEGAPSSISRLPAPTEAAIYVHHLAAKSKTVASQRVQDRLAGYASACAAQREPELAQALEGIAQARKVSPSAMALASGYLARFGVPSANAGRSRWIHKAAHELAAAWLAAPRKARCVAIMGCDGSGKTTLSKHLVDQEPETFAFYIGKHLFRKSMLYRALVTFVRPLTFRPREVFDDLIAPWNYIRAAASLGYRFRRGRSVTLIDRSIVDFLVVDRKTDLPRFRAGWLVSVLGRRIPTIHLVIPGTLLGARKLEMSLPAQKRYDEIMFRHFSERAPTDYAMFCNAGELAASAQAVRRLLRLMLRR